jgi:protein-disulfide isomerase
MWSVALDIDERNGQGVDEGIGLSGLRRPGAPIGWIIAGVLVVGLFACIAVVVAGMMIGGLLGQRTVITPLGPIAVATVPLPTAGSVAQAGPSRAASRYEGLAQSVDETGAIGFSIGDPQAPVVLVEYSDFSCPHCRNLAPAIEQIVGEYAPSGQVMIVYKPIVFVNPEASVRAGQAAICAARQGQFWEMHDEIWKLYDQGGPSAYTQQQLTDRARGLGLDVDQFTACFEDETTTVALDGVLSEAAALGVVGTPTLFLNDEALPYRGAETAHDDLVQAIESALNADLVDG